MEENIDVCIRVRPLNEREIKNKDVHVLNCLDSMNAISITDRNGTPLPGAGNVFQYDHIFSEKMSTRTIYDDVARRIVQSTLQGINGTIFAYGQTSSGKTHTMQGNLVSDLGILPLAVEHIFQYIEQSSDRDFLIRVSYVEIYNEIIRDLLSDDKEKSQNLKIREDPRRGIYLESHEEIITDYDTILRLVEQGEQRRTVGQTTMNERSSRSHSIFRIVIESKEKSPLPHSSKDDMDGAVLVGVLNLVDLAGSESVRHTAAEGLRQREAGNINRSLLTLSRVINSLAQGTESIQNAPFRDSKLTRLLQGSLAGSTRTLIICCVTPSDRHLEESKSTLQFAARAKNIQLNASVNEVLDDRAQLKRLKRELHELRQQVECNEALNALKAENMALAQTKTKHEAEIRRLMSLIVTSSKTSAKKPRVKRSRETWGPGDVFHSLQRHSNNLEQVILNELEKQGKKRKERHSEGSTMDDQLVSHLNQQLQAKEEEICQLKSRRECCDKCQEIQMNFKVYEDLVQTFDTERSTTQGRVEKLQAEVELFKAERDNLLGKLDDANKAASAFEEIIEEIESSRNDAIDQMMQIDAQRSELQLKFNDQVKLTEAADTMLKSLNEKCNSYEQKLAELESKLEKFCQDDSAAQNHKAEISVWRNMQLEWEIEIQKLNKEIQDKSTTLNFVNATLEEQTRQSEATSLKYEEEIARYQLEIQRLNQTLSENIKNLETWREDANSTSTEMNEQLKSILHNKDSVIEDLTKQISLLQANMDEIDVKSQEWKSMALDAEIKYKALLEQSEQWSDEKLQLDVRITELLSNQAQSSDAQVNELREMAAKVTELTRSKHELELKYGELSESFMSLQQVLDVTHQTHLEDLNARDELHKIELGQISSALTARDEENQQEISELGNSVVELKRQLEEAEKLTENLKAELNQVANEKDVIIREMDSNISNSAEWKASNEERIESMQNIIDDYQAKYQALLTEYNSLKESHPIEKAGDEQKLIEALDQISKLAFEKEQTQKEFDVLLANMTKKYEALQAELIQTQNDVMDYRGQIEKLKLQYDESNSSIKAMEQFIQDTKKLHREEQTILRDEIVKLETKLEDITAELNAMTSECSQIKLENLQLSSNNEQLVEEKLNAKTRINTMTHAYEELMEKWTSVNDEWQNKLDTVESFHRSELESMQKELDEELTRNSQLVETVNALEENLSNTDKEKNNYAQNLKAELQTLRNDLDTQLEEKETLYDKIDELEKRAIMDQQNFQESLISQKQQWDMEKATLSDQLEAQRDRINKLELVKMTKHHLEVFQKLKLENKKKSDEIAQLQEKLQGSSNFNNEVKLMEERWKHEQREKESLQLRMAEMKLELKTAQNEFHIKSSEVTSLKNTFTDYQDTIDTLQRQIRDQDNVFGQIADLRNQIDQQHMKMNNQEEKIQLQAEKIKLQADQINVQKEQLQAQQTKLIEKEKMLQEQKDVLSTKLDQWHANNESLQDKYQADLRYLEKENLELHMELKQIKRLLAENNIPQTPSKHTQRVSSLHEIHNSASKLKIISTPSKSTPTHPHAKQVDKENDPDTSSQPPECNQQ